MSFTILALSALRGKTLILLDEYKSMSTQFGEWQCRYFLYLQSYSWDLFENLDKSSTVFAIFLGTFLLFHQSLLSLSSYLALLGGSWLGLVKACLIEIMYYLSFICSWQGMNLRSKMMQKVSLDRPINHSFLASVYQDWLR